MVDLKNRVALVTGASRGIGRSIAEYLAQAGATVLCVSRNPVNCQSITDELLAKGFKAEAYALDVSSAQEVHTAAEKFLEKYACVDILVNNAGITRDTLIVKMGVEDWTSVLETNLFSAFYWVKELVRPMTQKRWGRIINISSIVGLTGNAGQCNYAAAKAGLLGFTKSLAKELAGRNITVNAIAPGLIDTDMTKGLAPEHVDQLKKLIPLKRMGTSNDVAEMVKFLASEHANYITGQVLNVDGGMVM